MSANTYSGLKPDGRAGLGRAFDARLDAMSSQLAGADRREAASARSSCEALLRAQLRRGAHVLPMASARVMALTVGLPPSDVRPGIGDPGAFKMRRPT